MARNAGENKDQSITAVVRDGGVALRVRGNQGGDEIRTSIGSDDPDQPVTYEQRTGPGLSDGVRPKMPFAWLAKYEAEDNTLLDQTPRTKALAEKTVASIQGCLSAKKRGMMTPD